MFASRHTFLKGGLPLALLALVLVVTSLAQGALTPYASSTGAAAPTIRSDKDDYAPGEAVTLTGANWQSGESVHISVNDDAGQTWQREVDVSADANGSFTDSFNLPDWFIATYTVRATGASGSATTTFTDGNVVVRARAGVGQPLAVQFPASAVSRFNNTTCTAPVAASNGGSFTTNGGNNNYTNSGVTANNAQSVRINAPSPITIGGTTYTFSGWDADSPAELGVSAGCISRGPNGGNDPAWNVTANYTAAPTNSAPTVAANTASVTVDEGQTAANSGTYSDSNAGDNVAITASIGTVTKTGTNSGTWSWSYATTDGPDNGQTVTITANDGNGGTTTTTFALVVNNVAPTVALTGDATAVEGQTKTYTFSVSDPGADTSSAVTGFPDCGTGGTFVSGSLTATTFQCSFPDGVATPTVRMRVADSDGAQSNIATVGVSVANEAPSGTFGNDGPVNEGSPFELSLSSVTDPSAPDTAAGFQYAFDCGDGAGYGAYGAANSRSCPTSDNGTRNVRAKVKDKDNGEREYTANVVVNNLDPTITAVTNNGPINEASSATITVTATDPAGANDPLAYEFDCDDNGIYEVGPQAGNSASCSFGDNGSRDVNVRVSDGDGGFAVGATTVTVNNVAPSIQSVTNDGPVDEGSSATITVAASDAAGANDPLAYEFDCNNDGTYEIGPQPGNTASCSFDDNGARQVNVRVGDGDGGSATGSTTVTVNNVDPTATFTNTAPVDEGTSFVLTLDNADDASSADEAAGFTFAFDCGDGSGYGAFSATPGQSGNRSCPTSDNGTRSVKGKIRDKNGGVTEYTDTVTINNVAPTITSVTNNGPVNEGSSVTVTVAATDPAGAADPLAYEFDCNNDGAYEVGPQAGNTASCSFGDNGSRQVNVRVSDGDGGSATGSTIVTVNNVNPTANVANNGPVDEGSSATVSFSNQHDPSQADTNAGFHYAFACDNGSLAAATYANSGTNDSTSCSFDDGPANGVVRARIIDKDGGFTEYTTTVEVRNVKPTADLGNNGPVDEGSSASVSFSNQHDSSQPDTNAGFHYAFSCSNGSLAAATYANSGASDSASCSFDDGPASQTVRARIIDKDGGFTEYTTTVVVNNVDPTASLGNNGPVDEGSPATVSFSNQHDPSQADTGAGFHYAYACDNGSLTSATYAGSGAAASHQCTFADNGSYPVRARIIDKNGGFSEYSTTVVVNNKAPVLTPPSDDTGVEGTSKTFGLGSFTDAGANDNPWHLHVTWGDGSAATGLSYGARGALGMAPHAYDDNGVYTVTETITDKDGGSDTQTFKVTIANANPTATLGNNGPVGEGGSATVSFSAPNDPSSADTTAGFHYAFACDNGSLAGTTYAGSGTSASQSCAFADNGSFPVKGRIIDKDGGFSEYTTTVVVNNANPAVTAAADQTSSEGATTAFDLGSFSDAGVNDNPWKVNVAWGDGQNDNLADRSSQGSLGNSSHKYADNGNYTVTVKVTDKDGGIGTATFKVTVANLKPTISNFSGTGSLFGPLVFAPSTFSGTFSDPGVNDKPWAATWKWDGAADASANQTYNVMGPFSQTHTFTTAGCSHSAEVTITDKDGASDTASATVQVGTGAFLPPMTNQPVTDKLKNGQVLPVKVEIKDCNGQSVTNLQPAIQLKKGDLTQGFADDSVVPIVPESVSSADTTGFMRLADSHYQYNMRVSVPTADLNVDYTVIVYPYGLANTSQTLRHVIRATK